MEYIDAIATSTATLIRATGALLSKADVAKWMGVAGTAAHVSARLTSTTASVVHIVDEVDDLRRSERGVRRIACSAVVISAESASVLLNVGSTLVALAPDSEKHSIPQVPDYSNIALPPQAQLDRTDWCRIKPLSPQANAHRAASLQIHVRGNRELLQGFERAFRSVGNGIRSFEIGTRRLQLAASVVELGRAMGSGPQERRYHLAHAMGLGFEAMEHRLPQRALMPGRLAISLVRLRVTRGEQEAALPAPIIEVPAADEAGDGTEVEPDGDHQVPLAPQQLVVTMPADAGVHLTFNNVGSPLAPRTPVRQHPPAGTGGEEVAVASSSSSSSAPQVPIRHHQPE